MRHQSGPARDANQRSRTALARSRFRAARGRRISEACERTRTIWVSARREIAPLPRTAYGGTRRHIEIEGRAVGGRERLPTESCSYSEKNAGPSPTQRGLVPV